MTSYELIKSKLKVVYDKGDEAQCLCPAHDDHVASLGIKYDKISGQTLINCFRGCSYIDILKSIGLSAKDKYDKSIQGNYITNNKNDIEAIYRYKDEQGNVLFEKVRFFGKRFELRRIIDGAIVWGIKEGDYYETKPNSNEWRTKKREGAKKKYFPESRKVLYNLPDVIEGVKNGQTIFIVEGEKDADNLKRLGFIATTNFDGASQNTQKPKWKKEYNKYFKGANVIIIPDNDEPGKAHATHIAKSLKSIVASVKILELEGLEEKQDISDWLKQGHTKEELEYLINELQEYKEQAAATIEQTIASLPKGLFEHNNCYCRVNKDDEIIEITNFIIEPLELVEGEEIKELNCIIHTKDGKQFKKTFMIKDLMGGYQSFKKALNQLLIFKGKDKELEEIKEIILSKTFERKQGVNVTGFHKLNDEWIFVSNMKVINDKLEPINNVVMLQKALELDSYILDTEPIEKDELEALLPHLFNFNEIGIAATIIAFTSAIFLKEKLWACNIKFPHLLITGQAGAGKTQTVENIICPILNIGTNLEDASSITKFSMIKKVASSNFAPLIIDEYKPYKLSKFIVNEISNLLRNVYDRHDFARGNPDLSLQQWKLQAPIILIGEDGFDETAVLERLLYVNMSKQDSKSYEKSFKFLKQNKDLLRKFGRALLNISMKITESQLKEMFDRYESIIPNQIQADRIRTSLTIATIGIDLIEQLLIEYAIEKPQDYGIDFDIIIKSLYKTAFEELLEGNENSKSAVDKTIELMDKLAFPGLYKLLEGIHFKVINGNELALDIKSIYYYINKEKKDSDEEILSERQFTKNLKKESYYAGYRTVKFYEDGTKSKQIVKRCYILNIQELLKKVEINYLIDTNYFYKIENVIQIRA